MSIYAEDWKAKIVRSVDEFMTDVYIYRRVGERIEVVQEPNEIRTYKIGETIPPSFKLQDSMMRALVDAIIGSGYEPSEVSASEGKLEVMYDYVEDLRHLLKLPKREPIITQRRI